MKSMLKSVCLLSLLISVSSVYAQRGSRTGARPGMGGPNMGRPGMNRPGRHGPIRNGGLTPGQQVIKKDLFSAIQSSNQITQKMNKGAVFAAKKEIFELKMIVNQSNIPALSRGISWIQQLETLLDDKYLSDSGKQEVTKAFVNHFKEVLIGSHAFQMIVQNDNVTSLQESINKAKLIKTVSVFEQGELVITLSSKIQSYFNSLGRIGPALQQALDVLVSIKRSGLKLARMQNSHAKTLEHQYLIQLVDDFEAIILRSRAYQMGL